jgi:uncharacterized membrane protein
MLKALTVVEKAVGLVVSSKDKKVLYAVIIIQICIIISLLLLLLRYNGSCGYYIDAANSCFSYLNKGQHYNFTIIDML